MAPAGINAARLLAGAGGFAGRRGGSAAVRLIAEENHLRLHTCCVLKFLYAVGLLIYKWTYRCLENNATFWSVFYSLHMCLFVRGICGTDGFPLFFALDSQLCQ